MVPAGAPLIVRSWAFSGIESGVVSSIMPAGSTNSPVTGMRGGAVRAKSNKETAMLTTMALEFHQVTFTPLQQFSVSAPDGVVVGVIGENSGGIHELMRLADGSVQPSAGRVVGPSQTFPFTLDGQDAIERARTSRKLEEQRRNGNTILIASHDEALLGEFCDELWWVDGGRLAMKGDPREVLDAYRRHVAKRLREDPAARELRLDPRLRRGDGRAELIAVETLGADGVASMVWQSGERVSVRIRVRFHAAVENPVVGMMIRTRIGFEVYGTNTELEKVKLGPCLAGDTREITFSFVCALCPQEYTLTAASHDPDGVWHDWLEDAVAFSVADTRYTAGVANLRAQVSSGVRDSV